MTGTGVMGLSVWGHSCHAVTRGF